MKTRRANQVGISTVKFDYHHIQYDKEGWAPVKRYLPRQFDLMKIKTIREGREAVITGWWTGSHWEGRALIEKDEVVSWKKDNYNNHDK